MVQDKVEKYERLKAQIDKAMKFALLDLVDDEPKRLQVMAYLLKVRELLGGDRIGPETQKS